MCSGVKLEPLIRLYACAHMCFEGLMSTYVNLCEFLCVISQNEVHQNKECIQKQMYKREREREKIMYADANL